MRRRTFLWRLMCVLMLFVLLYGFLERSIGRASTLVLYPPLFGVVLSLAVRRLHDQARGAWWVVVALVPLLGPLLLGFLLFGRRGTDGENQHGEDPRTHGRDYLRVAIHEPA